MKVELKKLFGQIKNTKVLCVIFILGIALLMLPGGSKKNSENSNVKTTDDFTSYQKELEEDLCKIISKIKGVGKVDVMIILEDTGNTYFAKDESQNTVNNDGETSKNRNSTHVLKKESSNSEEALITKKTYPEISGVLICAKGADDPQIKNNIIKASRALLGVKSNRIEVLERK